MRGLRRGVLWGYRSLEGMCGPLFSLCFTRACLEFFRGISLLVNIDQVRERKKVYFGYPHDKSPGQDFCPWVGPLE